MKRKAKRNVICNGITRSRNRTGSYGKVKREHYIEKSRRFGIDALRCAVPVPGCANVIPYVLKQAI